LDGAGDAGACAAGTSGALQVSMPVIFHLPPCSWAFRWTGAVPAVVFFVSVRVEVWSTKTITFARSPLSMITATRVTLHVTIIFCFGVLACTSQRLPFLFVGIVRKQVLEVDWNQAKAAIYNRSTKVLAVYTTRPTKRAMPAMAVRVNNAADAHAIVDAAEAALAAPRLDVM
jgi:hypothetical protein